ncbi:ABC-ATPase domain-containing protein [Pelagicoccus sp. SDUM812005]|uniref:ABC-ATPase domain-containing protein n=1 Tax=Pelagicoccus sp. SDUM812005 TaxID=3041257 RepID=UPI00280F9F18|nr:ABC-ATPase domain-containing protein [Pelagicoccus sp. SDUM812005]MDQ8181783.1 ABC-ATPase domain-containing protein [Pelagicoccus sp. SDUM812005]
MQHKTDLSRTLERIDGRPYPAYKDIRGRYDFEFFDLSIDKVQGDPFASPSRLSIIISHQESELPTDLFSNPSRRTGTENYLALAFSRACRQASSHSGSGKSGLISIDTPGQEMLARSCVEIGPSETVVRFSVGLPANGRRIRGRSAKELLIKQLPDIVEDALCYDHLDAQAVAAFADTAEDADTLRSLLAERKLVAFVADGAILPRASGIDERPMPNAVPFQSPESFRQTFELPHAGNVSGMAIPEGVTLIVGGGYHGKSTLLSALERGVYNHRPQDGRERVVARADTTKVRAEDGRSVASVDLTPFIGQLPGGKDSSNFSTENASGSSSQAASIIEALETGAKTLLLDEDISATNLLIRDARMQQLIAKEKEPITPFVQRVRSLYEDCGVSTVIVLGGSGDYFEPADHVIALDNYIPHDLTQEAKALCDGSIIQQKLDPSTIATSPEASKRKADPVSIDPYTSSRGRPGRSRVKTRDARSITFGEDEIDLSLIPQIVDSSQAKAIGSALLYASEQRLFEEHLLPVALQRTLELANTQRLSALGPGDLAQIRLQELAAALNRLRSLRIH